MMVVSYVDCRCSTFKHIEEESQKLLAKSAIARFADKGEDSKLVTTLIERLREAIVCYQVPDYYPHRQASSLTGGAGVATTSHIQSNQSSHCEAIRSSLWKYAALNPSIVKSSFDILLKFREVTYQTTLITALADEPTETSRSEGKARISRCAAGSTQRFPLEKTPPRAVDRVD